MKTVTFDESKWKLVPIKPTAWRPGSETPPVKEGKAQEFILAVDDE